MARKRNRTNNPPRRDAPRIANRRLFEETFYPRSLSRLTLIEDRRNYYPDAYTRPAHMLSTPRHRLVLKPNVVKARPSPSVLYRAPTLPVGVAFQTPKRVSICIRRQRRKEVIHALGKSGRGVSRKKPRRSEYSDITC